MWHCTSDGGRGDQCHVALHSRRWRWEFGFRTGRRNQGNRANLGKSGSDLTAGSRYLLLQTLQTLPAFVNTYQTMECFLLLGIFNAFRSNEALQRLKSHRVPCPQPKTPRFEALQAGAQQDLSVRCGPTSGSEKKGHRSTSQVCSSWTAGRR